MAYSDFKTLLELEKKFGVKNRRVKLFGNFEPLAISDDLKKQLAVAEELPIKSEKAKSELIVTPILIELRQRNKKYITIYSGDALNADTEKGLNGECDFIIAKDTGSFEVACPILQIVEAKRNDVETGVAQCAAQMLGAKFYNQKNAAQLDVVYGCVTTGDDWLFLSLEQDLLMDTRKYYLGNVGELLAAFQHIIDFFKQTLN